MRTGRQKTTYKQSVWKRLHKNVKQSSSKLPDEISSLLDEDGQLKINEPSKIMLGVKRLIDIFGSLVLIIVLSPILLATYILIRILMDDPIFYREERIGYKGKHFSFIKFKSMINDAQSQKDKLVQHNEMQGPFFKVQNDPRVTDFGRFLRKYSVDELPQLFLVLKGDMSLVGPRPCQPKEYKNLDEWQQKAKTSMKPGITCIWQVNGRNLISDHNQWMKMDLDYVRNWSLWLDIKLLLKTIPAALSGIGAS